MDGFVRYGIYVVPKAALYRAGADWLGWDSETGRAAPQPALDGLPESPAALTASPRRYGFHGTIKPPFRLAAGTDPAALAAALRENRLAGAAIDVFPVEPKSNDEEFISPLREFDNCILTPHVGGSTMEAQRNIGIEVSEKLVRYSDNGSSFASVNFPEVSLPAHPGKHRLLHIHKNVPGVLSQINSIFSENGINISSQYLQTNDKVGYVVMDVDVDASELALARLNEVNGTIKSRVLF